MDSKNDTGTTTAPSTGQPKPQQDPGTTETASSPSRTSKEKPLPAPPSSEKKEAKFRDVKIPRKELGLKVRVEPQDVEEIEVEYVQGAPMSICDFFVSRSTCTDVRLMSKAL